MDQLVIYKNENQFEQIIIYIAQETPIPTSKELLKLLMPNA